MSTTISRPRISHLTRVSYCLCIAVILTALGFLLDNEAGWSLAFPGRFIADILTAVFTTGDNFAPAIAWQVPNVVFYLVMFYGISWVYTGLREEKEYARTRVDKAGQLSR